MQAVRSAFVRAESFAQLRLAAIRTQRALYEQGLEEVWRILLTEVEPIQIGWQERLHLKVAFLAASMARFDRLIEEAVSGGDAGHLAAFQAQLEATGPMAKPALRKLARDSDVRIATVAAAAHDHVRREQLWLMFVTAAGKDHGAADSLFAELMDVPFAADRLEAVADDLDDPAELYTRWHTELTTRVDVSVPEVAAWLLLGTHPDTRSEQLSEYPFLDPARNSQLAKVLTDRTASRPLRRLASVWSEIHKNDAAARRVVGWFQKDLK